MEETETPEAPEENTDAPEEAAEEKTEDKE